MDNRECVTRSCYTNPRPTPTIIVGTVFALLPALAIPAAILYLLTIGV